MGRATLSVVVLAALISTNAESLAGLADDFRDHVNLERTQTSAAAGDANAIGDLADRYWRGDGVRPDAAKAVDLYRRAADLGDGRAMLQLGFLHENGRVLSQSHEQAVAWYRRAADSGSASAMFHLGVMCWAGRGVTQDLVEAYKWLVLGSASGASAIAAQTASARDALARVLTAEQVAEARKRAHEWQSAHNLPKRGA